MIIYIYIHIIYIYIYIQICSPPVIPVMDKAANGSESFTSGGGQNGGTCHATTAVFLDSFGSTATKLFWLVVTGK